MACSFLSNEPLPTSLRPSAACAAAHRIAAYPARIALSVSCSSDLREPFELGLGLEPFGFRLGDHPRQLGAPLERLRQGRALAAEGVGLKQAAVERLLLDGKPRRRRLGESGPAAQWLQRHTALGRLASSGAAI